MSKLVGIGGGGRASRDEKGSSEPSSGSPSSPPGHQTPVSGVAARPLGDAFTAPTIRPPAAPSSELNLPSAAAVSAAFSETESGHAGAGFTSVIRHLSLAGWLRWIYSNRSDATLRIRTWEGGGGRIWCSGGEIIDAEWDGRIAEEALDDMLVISSGSVTIDFDRVEHPRRVVTPTFELLHVGEGDSDRIAIAMHAEAARAASASGSVYSEPFRPTLSSPAASIPPIGNPSSFRSKPDSRRLSRGDYLAGLLLLCALAVAAFAFGRLRASGEPAQSNAREPVPMHQPPMHQTTAGLLPPPAPAKAAPEVPTITPKPRDLPVISFVPIEVEPAHAEIWLDRERVGVGRIQLGAIHDGMMHELLFVAPGHEPKSLFFRDAPPAGRVILKRLGDSENVAANPKVEGPPSETLRGPAHEAAGVESETRPAATEHDVAPHDVAQKVARRRAAAPAPDSTRGRAAAEDPSSGAKPAAKKSPQIEVIEVHTPRVQVLD